jgi:hypothetical protein
MGISEEQLLQFQELEDKHGYPVSFITICIIYAVHTVYLK